MNLEVNCVWVVATGSSRGVGYGYGKYMYTYIKQSKNK